MDIEEKSRSDLIERYKRLEQKEASQQKGLSKSLKNFLLSEPNQVIKPPKFALKKPSF